MKKLTILATCLLVALLSCKKEIKEEKPNLSTAAAGSVNMDGDGEDEDSVYQPTMRD